RDKLVTGVQTCALPISLVIVEAAGDKLVYRTVETSQIYQPGPRFGPDGNIYVIVHYHLYRIEGDQKIDIMRGNNCICIDPAGRRSEERRVGKEWRSRCA